MARLLPGRSSIGVVELHGVIGASIRPGDYYQLLDRVERSPRIGAVVLDIDSPGGSVSASEDLYLKVARVREKKPVIAFIRGTGASGSYMIACAASKIVALPSAIVGSIGVISMRPVLTELLERVGVSVSVSKSGPFKDMGAFYRPPTEDEQAKMQSLIEELFEVFVERVATARGMDVGRARLYATGEVYTARHGKELGLVDEIADFDSALDMAAEVGRVRRKATYLRPPRPLRTRMLGRFAGWAMEGMWEEAGASGRTGLWYL